MKKTTLVLSLTVLTLGFSGCGAYRTESGITPPSSKNKNIKPSIMVTELLLENKNCKTLENIDTSIKKLTLFHPDPTKEQANYVLAEKGKKIGANVIRNVKYESGVGLTTWGYIDAKGDASKCDLN
ncbi:MAG: hypothetical protein K8R39_02930 [Arcobacteraceae bacterium]|nr:hypothetical protein [Arcobacteraceae bacterium]